jgi:hypothetical protein
MTADATTMAAGATMIAGAAITGAAMAAAAAAATLPYQPYCKGKYTYTQPYAPGKPFVIPVGVPHDVSQEMMDASAAFQ